MWEASAHMPARWVPLLYFAFAHLCLAMALAALVFAPTSLVGFFYHPRMLAVVHLVTLGWISLPKGQAKKPQESARKAEVSRPIWRAKAI